jgi:hypothetical protein
MQSTVVAATVLCGTTALAQKCDPSVPGNSNVTDPAKCWIRAAEGNGIVIGLPPNSKRRVDPAKVPACTALGAQLMRRMAVKHDEYVATVSFGSIFTFSNRCDLITLNCQVLETGDHPELNKAPWGSISNSCDASADRYTEALRIIVPGAPAGKITSFVARCMKAAKAGKQDGPEDVDTGKNVLICDPRYAGGPEVRIEPRD